MNQKTIDAWAKDLGNHVITDAFVGVVSGAGRAAVNAARWA